MVGDESVRRTGSQPSAQRKMFQALLTGRCVRVLGPRYMGKSRLVKEVVDWVRQDYSQHVSYQTMEDYKQYGWADFYTHLYRNIETDIFPDVNPVENIHCATPLDLQKNLLALMKRCSQNLVIFVDDLEIAPPNLIASLLGVIRALYMVSFSQPGSRFQAAVCGSLSFSQLALPYVSRFESISELVMIGDLNDAEQRTMLDEFCARYAVQTDEKGIRTFLGYTGGDRYLIRRLLEFTRLRIDGSDEFRITPAIVENAVREFMQHVMEAGTGEIIRQIESDPILLSCVLKVLDQERVAARQMPLPTIEIPNVLDLIGVFRKEDQHYLIKCPLWKQILQERLTPARVGRLYALASYWQQSIDYLSQEMDNQPDVKLDLFNATINIMHASPNGLTAYLNLARGLRAVYPDCPFRLFQRTASSLVQVYPEEDPRPEILTSVNQPEVDALHGPDYSVIFDASFSQFLFPLRVRSDAEALGMVSFCQNLNRYLTSGHQEEIYQLIGFLRQAARAIEARDTYGRKLVDAESRAEKQKNLAKILTLILHDHNLPRETVFRLVMAGVTSGLGLEFNRAILFTLDEKGESLVAQIGVGHITRSEADQDWKKFPYKTLDELIDALLVADYHYTTLHNKVYGKNVPARPETANLFAKALEDQEPKISWRHLSLEGLPQPLTETIGGTESFALIPFKASPYLTGVLYVDNSFTLHEISEERILLLSSFMSQAALVMELARSLRQEQSRAEVLTGLLQAEEAINEQTTRDLAGVYDKITERARLLFGARNTVLTILKSQIEEGKTVFVTDHILYKGTSRADYGDLPRSDRGFIRHIIEEGFVHIPNIDQDDSSNVLADMRNSSFVKEEHIRAMAGIRIGPVNEPEGVLYLNWDAPRRLTGEERTLMTIFASFASVTIPSARRYQQVQEDLRYRTREMEGLSQLLKAGTQWWSEEEIQKIIEQALTTTRSLTGIDGLSLFHRGPFERFQQYSLALDGTLVSQSLKPIPNEQIAQAFIGRNGAALVMELEDGLLWPIQVAGNLLATIHLQTPDKLLLLEKHKEYLDHLCNRLALTFHQSQMYPALNQLFQSALRMTQNMESPDFLIDFMNQLAKEALDSIFSVDTITIYYREKETGRLKFGAAAGLKDLESIRTTLPEGTSVQKAVLNANEPIFAEDVRTNLKLMGPFVDREDIVSAAAYPLRVGENRVGCMFFSYRHVQKFDPGEKSLLRLFAQLAAIAINQTFLQDEAVQRQKRLETVAHIIEHLSEAGSDMENMYSNLFQEVLQAIPNAHNACIIQKDLEKQQFFIVPASLPFYRIRLEPNQDTLRLGNVLPRGIAIRVIETGIPALVNDVLKDRDYIPAITTTHSEICAPVELDGKPHAAILLESDLRNAFTVDDQLMLSALAPVISIAIQRVEQMLRQRERAEQEKMKGFSTLLVHEIAHAVANIPDLIEEIKESVQKNEPIDAECLDDLTLNAEQAKQLTTFVQAMSRVSMYQPEYQALDPVIEAVVEQARKIAPAHVRLEFHERLPAVSLTFDNRLLRMLLKNIIENAIHAIPPDRAGRVEISTEILSRELAIHIRDNGAGISQEHQALIFKLPFSTKDDQTQIHGFGLWLCNEIVTMHKGEISFTTFPGAGTTFTVTLPLILSQEIV